MVVTDAEKGTKTLVKKPRMRNAANSREKLLRAGITEFAKHGFSGARIDRIVKNAGTNQRMLYHYFKDKAGFYVAVLEKALEGLRREEMKIDFNDVSPLEGLLQLFNFMNGHFETNSNLVRLLSGENIQRARYLKKSERVNELASSVLESIKELLRLGESDGSLRKGIDPLEVYVMMVALNQFHLSNAYTLSVIFQTDLTEDEWRKSQHAAALEMVRAYLISPNTNKL